MTYEQLASRYDNETPDDREDDDKCECCGQRKCVYDQMGDRDE